jgi:hypothetical protein
MDGGYSSGSRNEKIAKKDALVFPCSSASSLGGFAVVSVLLLLAQTWTEVYATVKGVLSIVHSRLSRDTCVSRSTQA